MWYCKNCKASPGRNAVHVEGGVGVAVGIVEIAGADVLAPLDDVYRSSSCMADGVVVYPSGGGTLAGSTFGWDSQTNDFLAITAAACHFGALSAGSGFNPLNVDQGVFGEWGWNYAGEYGYATVNTAHTDNDETYAMMTVTLHRPRPAISMGGGWTIEQSRIEWLADYYTCIAPYPHSNTTGNLLVCFTWGSSTNINVTDSLGNTWQRVTAQLVPTGVWTNTYPTNLVQVGGGGDVISLWYAKNCQSGSNVVTVSGVSLVQILEVSGADTTNPLDTTTSQYASDGVSGPVYNYGDGTSDAAQLLQYCGVGLSDKMASWQCLYEVDGPSLHGNSLALSFGAATYTGMMSAPGNWLGLIRNDTPIFSEAGCSNGDNGHCVTVGSVNAIMPAISISTEGVSWGIIGIVLHPPR